MRYYVYLDKELIKNLYSSLDDANFDIDIIEYSIEESQNLSQNSGVEPNFSTKKDKNNKRKEFNIKVNERNNIDIYKKIEKKFININTVSEIKSMGFYNKLIKRIELSHEKNIFIGTGNIFPYMLVNKFDCRINLESNNFFILDNNIIWINAEYLDSEFIILCNLVCNVNVVGYIINDSCDKKIVKAMAIYIE